MDNRIGHRRVQQVIAAADQKMALVSVVKLAVTLQAQASKRDADLAWVLKPAIKLVQL